MLNEYDDDNFLSEDGSSKCIASVEDCDSHGLLKEDLVKKWEDAKLITQRYKKYREHARYQQNIILSGNFIDGLVQGLARLHFSIEEIMPATASLALTLRLLKDDEMFPKYKVEMSRYYNS